MTREKTRAGRPGGHDCIRRRHSGRQTQTHSQQLHLSPHPTHPANHPNHPHTNPYFDLTPLPTQPVPPHTQQLPTLFSFSFHVSPPSHPPTQPHPTHLTPHLQSPFYPPVDSACALGLGFGNWVLGNQIRSLLFISLPHNQMRNDSFKSWNQSLV